MSDEEQLRDRVQSRLETLGPSSSRGPEVEPLTAPVPGTAIVATTTIDALFTAVFGTRSADLVAAGTPVYSWVTPNIIMAQWPTLQVGATPSTPNYSMISCTFIARSVMGSSIAQ